MQPDPVIGSLFAWGSLAMGIGLLIAPPLAERIGKIQRVAVTQALSIPFLIMLGFAPWFWMSATAYYNRLALMNMSSPVYQTFVMEHTERLSKKWVWESVHPPNGGEHSPKILYLALGLSQKVFWGQPLIFLFIWADKGTWVQDG
jgi:hypothetical protein